VIGHSAKETLALVPGSHKQTYPKYLPENSKFTKDEYRFAGNRRKLKIIRPELQEGEVIIFHPALLHEEEVTESPITRFNLEIRFMPQEDAI
jgi:ectoine hydroxylase-related dioxygenase (phytanoyl-CoA dioxygenase family)